jgi:hypothetical protein
MIQTWKNREEKAKEPTFTLSALWNEGQKKSSQEREREREKMVCCNILECGHWVPGLM